VQRINFFHDGTNGGGTENDRHMTSFLRTVRWTTGPKSQYE